jgi:mannose-6-phosphate isomerase-like protein (cupin superfamily)
MADQIVHDPLFKQSYRFADAGETLRIEIQTEPGGGVLAEHVHPALEERYEILEGEITFSIDGESRNLGPGERAVVAPGVRHRFENTGGHVSRLLVEAEPAQDLRASIEAGARLMLTERFTSSGSPKSFRALVEAAAVARRYRDTVVLTSPPPLVQRILFPVLAGFARSAPR